MITYVDIEGLPQASIVQSILQLYQQLFQNIDHRKFETRMNSEQIFSIIALEGTRVVGFKIGYQMEPGVFYSWIGGVLPEYRNRGIAQTLMAYQHNWCRQNDFRIVRTKTMNRWRDMLILNLKNGFDIVSTYTDEGGILKILLEKNLMLSN